jgi:hypothetical protein
MFLDEYITANKGLSQHDNPVVLTVDSKKKGYTDDHELPAEMLSNFRRGKN